MRTRGEEGEGEITGQLALWCFAHWRWRYKRVAPVLQKIARTHCVPFTDNEGHSGAVRTLLSQQRAGCWRNPSGCTCEISGKKQSSCAE